MLPTTLALLLALSGSALAAPTAAPKAAEAPQPGNARAALIGEWRVLGPASQAHLTQMIRLTLRPIPPTAAEFEAARLDEAQARQVESGRARVRDEPESEAVKGLRADWAQLDSARAAISESNMDLRFGETTERFTYKVLGQEGIRVQARMSGPQGEQDIVFTVIDNNTLMFGPMGAEPTVLYRLTAP
jgi:hypothetical protein